jgi:hypothetical protein
LKTLAYIFIISNLSLLIACSGSKKYFKAAEKLEKQGLVNEAADYYLQSLQRKPTNVEARIKLKETGQKYTGYMASEFFRNFNTQQLEPSLDAYERMKAFTDKTAVLNVMLDYPKAYDDDYKQSVETFCSKNYDKAYLFVNQKKFGEALTHISKIKKYNSAYKTTPQLEIIAICEPLYQSAVNSLETKNYAGALNLLTSIKAKTENYKDSRDLLELASDQQTKHFMIFEPKNTVDKSEKEIEDYLFDNFNQVAAQKFNNAKIINNTPFVFLSDAGDINAAGNVDLIQAIRKATGSDFFYVYDVANRKEYSPTPQKTYAKAFQEVKTRVNDTLIKTEYKVVDYNVVKASKVFSYDYKFKLVNAYSNQIISSQVVNVSAQDAVEYNEFAKTYQGNMNTLYPYNPQQTAPIAQFNPKNWRGQFTARSALKPIDDLKMEAHNKTLSLFSNSILNSIK